MFILWNKKYTLKEKVIQVKKYNLKESKLIIKVFHDLKE